MVGTQLDQGGSDAEQLGHRRGCKELVAVLLVNRQPAAEVNHEKSPVTILVARSFKNSVHAPLGVIQAVTLPRVYSSAAAAAPLERTNYQERWNDQLPARFSHRRPVALATVPRCQGSQTLQLLVHRDRQ